MIKHTPGPWTVEKSLEQKHGTRVIAIAPVAWCGTNSSFGVDGNQSISAKQARANAHLIAAAPDLLEALQRAINRQGFSNQELIEARAAIAKAKEVTE